MCLDAAPQLRRPSSGFCGSVRESFTKTLALATAKLLYDFRLMCGVYALKKLRKFISLLGVRQLDARQRMRLRVR
jgi:hypothetical protein